MQDISGGKERVRIWPRKRPKNKKVAVKRSQDKFFAAQMATKYLAPQINEWAYEVTKNSPLLPRDVLTMMLYQRLYAFVLPSGKILYPMTGISDVSASLDVIGANVGDTVMRTPEGWRAVAASQQGLIGAIVTRAAGFQSGSANVAVPVEFDVAEVDQGSMWSASDPTKLIAPLTGWCMVSFTTDFSTSSQRYRKVQIYQEGLSKANLSVRNGNIGSANQIAVSTILYTQQNDEIQCMVQSASSNTSWNSNRAALLYL